MDDHHHGTHVAGTIGAAGNNGIGVAGVNWTTRMMGIKFLDSSGSGTTADAIAAIEFAIAAKQAFAATGAANIRVLSNSWGDREFSQALLDQVNAANAADMLFVAAAGNDGFDNDILPMYPASFAAPNVISVAATSNTDDRAWFSNYGASSVHLAAPGVDILSTMTGGTYALPERHVDGDAARLGRRGARAVGVRDGHGGAEGDAAGHGRNAAVARGRDDDRRAASSQQRGSRLHAPARHADRSRRRARRRAGDARVARGSRRGDRTTSSAA